MPPFEATELCLGKDVTFFESASHISFSGLVLYPNWGPYDPCYSTSLHKHGPIRPVCKRTAEIYFAICFALSAVPALFRFSSYENIQHGFDKYAPNPYEVPQ
jgi:hypothetical protein